jgi:hypothetical protein
MCLPNNNNNNNTTTMSTTTMSGHIANVPHSTSQLTKRPRAGNSAFNSTTVGIRRASGFRTKAVTMIKTPFIRSSAFPVIGRPHHHHLGTTKHARESQEIGESPTKKLQLTPVTFGCPLFPNKQPTNAANTAAPKGNQMIRTNRRGRLDNKSQKKKFFKLDMSFMDAMVGVEPIPTPMDGVVRLPQPMFPFVDSTQPMSGVQLLPPAVQPLVVAVSSFPKQRMAGMVRLPQQMFPFIDSTQPMSGVQLLPPAVQPFVVAVSSFPQQPMTGVVRLPQQMFPFVDSPQPMQGVQLLPPTQQPFTVAVASFPQHMVGVQRLPQQMFPFINWPQPMDWNDL